MTNINSNKLNRETDFGPKNTMIIYAEYILQYLTNKILTFRCKTFNNIKIH